MRCNWLNRMNGFWFLPLLGIWKVFLRNEHALHGSWDGQAWKEREKWKTGQGRKRHSVSVTKPLDFWFKLCWCEPSGKTDFFFTLLLIDSFDKSCLQVENLLADVAYSKHWAISALLIVHSHLNANWCWVHTRGFDLDSGLITWSPWFCQERRVSLSLNLTSYP